MKEKIIKETKSMLMAILIAIIAIVIWLIKEQIGIFLSNFAF